MKRLIDKVTEQWNEISDSDWYMSYRTDDVINGIIHNPSSAFHAKTWEVITGVLPTFTDKKICVPSSGDNRAVFAFAALGAKVTSCDICDRQLEYAKGIAEKHHLDIEFIVQDTMFLPDIKSDEYDLVYTSEGVHVWINNLASMYQNIYRILKKNGIYINYEIHPFTRPFAYEDGKPEDKKIIIQKPYDRTGPFDEGVTYHWRMQDILNAVSSADFTLKRLEEMFDEKDKGHFWFYEKERSKMTQAEIDTYYDFQTNPLYAIPHWFTIYAVK